MPCRVAPTARESAPVTLTADAAELLELFHTQVRLNDRDAAPGFVVDRDGPVHRTYPPDAA